MKTPPSKPVPRVWPGPAIVALAAWLGVMCCLDPAGDYPDAPQGPGLTVDEIFNVQEGVRLAVGLKEWGRSLATFPLTDLFDDQARPPVPPHNPDHPPLGRLWIGVFHNLALSIAPPADHQTPFVIAAGRTAPATAFALTVLLVGLVTGRWYGPLAGTVAALSLVLMPRLFGHAHLASLESFIGLAYAAAALGVAAAWTGPAPPSSKAAAWTGALLGLALLTKVQGILLTVPVGFWALGYWRWRALRPLAVWGGVGLAVFFVGWPWLWLDPLDHFREFLGRTTGRLAIHVWYFGQQYDDTAVPWHYPWVMFLATVPLGLQWLGILGLCADRLFVPERRTRTEPGTHKIDEPAWTDARMQPVLGSILFPLVLFSLPGIAVYDGARLFLVVFPLWGVPIGRGAAVAWDWLRKWITPRVGIGLAVLFLGLQSWGLIALHPVYLSYYSLQVGGLPLAARMGLEVNYWSDSLTRRLLRETVRHVPRGATVEVSPVLHQFQLVALWNQSPLLRRHGVRLVEFRPGPAPSDGPRYVLTYERRADLPDRLRGPAPNAIVLAEVTRQGVRLAALYNLTVK